MQKYRSDGPHLQMALFCESVIEDRRGALSIIRIISERTIVGTGDAPEAMPPLDLAVKVVIALKSGAARGKHHVRLVMESPSGARPIPELRLPVRFEGEDRGENIVGDLSWKATEEGIYWVDVLLGDALLTRMPFRVLYEKAQWRNPPHPL